MSEKQSGYMTVDAEPSELLVMLRFIYLGELPGYASGYASGYA